MARPCVKTYVVRPEQFVESLAGGFRAEILLLQLQKPDILLRVTCKF